MAETQVRGWLLQGWDKFATVPQVLSLEGTAKEGDKETGGILRRHISQICCADISVAVVVDLATGSLHFLRGKGGKQNLEGNNKKHKRGFSILDASLLL